MATLKDIKQTFSNNPGLRFNREFLAIELYGDNLDSLTTRQREQIQMQLKQLLSEGFIIDAEPEHQPGEFYKLNQRY
jgi:ribulose bisphosphate carboxylase small subunit